MRATNTGESWGWIARLIHWVMAGLILFQLALGIYMVRVEDLFAQFALIQTHKSWGFVIFSLALLRVVWRLANRTTPRRPSAMPDWQARAAGVSHALLYLLLFVMPVSGWIMASASPTQDLLNIENMVFGAFALPDPWVPGVKSIEDAANAVHYAAGLLLAAVLVLHAGAALKHHLADRDDVLARMTWGR